MWSAFGWLLLGVWLKKTPLKIKLGLHFDHGKNNACTKSITRAKSYACYFLVKKSLVDMFSLKMALVPSKMVKNIMLLLYHWTKICRDGFCRSFKVIRSWETNIENKKKNYFNRSITLKFQFPAINLKAIEKLSSCHVSHRNRISATSSMNVWSIFFFILESRMTHQSCNLKRIMLRNCLMRLRHFSYLHTLGTYISNNKKKTWTMPL